jgi:hypothetical protein
MDRSVQEWKVFGLNTESCNNTLENAGTAYKSDASKTVKAFGKTCNGYKMYWFLRLLLVSRNAYHSDTYILSYTQVMLELYKETHVGLHAMADIFVRF